MSYEAHLSRLNLELSYGPPTVPVPGVMVVGLLPRVATTTPTTTAVATTTVPLTQTFLGM
jgi:hypothetical protein